MMKSRFNLLTTHLINAALALAVVTTLAACDIKDAGQVSNDSGAGSTSDGATLNVNLQQTDAGIKGTVMYGPICGTQLADNAGPCADKPYSVELDIYKCGISVPAQCTNLVGSVTSDQNGQFKVSLETGTYLIVRHAKMGDTTLNEQSMYPIIGPILADVVPHQFTEVQVYALSGIL